MFLTVIGVDLFLIRHLQVLAFEETPSLKTSGSPYGHRKDSSLPILHSRAVSQPLPSNQKAYEVTATVQPKRARAPSDPFLDAPPSRSLGSSSQSPNTESLLSSSKPPIEEIVNPAPRYGDTTMLPLQEEASYDDDDDQFLRTWTSPDLSNPEILQLLELFPSFVSRRPLPRFPVSHSRHVDIEEGEDEGLEGRQIHFGTGSMWVSSKQRSDTWEGGWWTRFVMWWKRLFC